MTDWIPCTTKLPDDPDKCVIVWRPDSFYGVAGAGTDFYRNGLWWMSGPDDQPTHWAVVEPPETK